MKASNPFRYDGTHALLVNVERLPSPEVQAGLGVQLDLSKSAPNGVALARVLWKPLLHLLTDDLSGGALVEMGAEQSDEVLLILLEGRKLTQLLTMFLPRSFGMGFGKNCFGKTWSRLKSRPDSSPSRSLPQ